MCPPPASFTRRRSTSFFRHPKHSPWSTSGDAPLVLRALPAGSFFGFAVTSSLLVVFENVALLEIEVHVAAVRIEHSVNELPTGVPQPIEKFSFGFIVAGVPARCQVLLKPGDRHPD
jgi:hypothetical protein